jgi:hypothetical protein
MIDRITLAIGVLLTVCGALASFCAGWSMGVQSSLLASLIAGCILGSISVLVSVGLHYVNDYRARGQWGAALGFGVFWIALLFTEFVSQSIFMVGHREANIDQAVMQDTVYEDSRASLEDQKAQIAMWSKHLSDLEAQNSWTSSVTADSLRAKLESAGKAIDIEAAAGGCKVKCLALMKERDDLKSRIAILEQRDDLAKQIGATQALLDKARGKAATVAKGDSVVMASSGLIATVVTRNLKPGQEALGWANIGTGTWQSIIGAIAAAIAIAWACRDKSGAVSGFGSLSASPAQNAAASDNAELLGRLSLMLSGKTPEKTTVIEKHFAPAGILPEAIQHALKTHGLAA